MQGALHVAIQVAKQVAMQAAKTMRGALCVGLAAGVLCNGGVVAASAVEAPKPLTILLYEAPAAGVGTAGSNAQGSNVSRSNPPGSNPPGPNVQASKASSPEIDEQLSGNHVLRNVTEPTLTVYLPDPAKATGTGVIIAPGGAFMMLSIDYEGHDVARWLAARGVAAFVLKYRLDETPTNDLLFDAVLIKRLYGVQHRSGVDLPQYAGESLGAADGFQAMRLVKRRAAEWRLDPNRIGFLGFSAGAIIALHLASDYDAATRPAFVAPIYGLKTFTHPVRADAPPLFIAIASDDPFFPTGATDLYTAWRKAGVAAELHVYEQGGHGFGMKPAETTSSHWIDEFYWWLQGRKLLMPAR
jgi:acetyl esterase/lipase